MLNKNTALMIAGIVFALVALVHLWRLVFAVEIVVDGFTLPMWVSVVGFIITIVLSLLMFLARKK